MVIENAERFGLAQIHQLRGRVGRGAAQSYCVLVTDKLSEMGKERIRSTSVDSTDGFYIAEMDLRLRGPGEFLGTKQSGLPVSASATCCATRRYWRRPAPRRSRSWSTRPRTASWSARLDISGSTGSAGTAWL